jgi:protein gp37
MADGTKIEWTDATWNVITGCSVLSPGCKHCYAMKLAGTRLRNHPSRAGLTVETKTGPVWNGEVRFNDGRFGTPDWLRQPLHWAKPRMIFVCAHADLFHDGVDETWLDQIFAVMALARHHTFQVLTKRADAMHDYLSDPIMPQRVSALLDGLKPSSLWNGNVHQAGVDLAAWPLKNVWLGVSVEDQQRANERIPALLATPAAVRWVSCEPLLGPVDLRSIKAPGEKDETDGLDWRFDALEVGDYYWFDGEGGQPGDCGDGPYRDHRIDWVVAGGENGPRPMHPDWARALRDQCASATLHGDDAPVPFLFKQWGEWETGLDRERDDPDWRADYTNDYVDHGKSRWLNLAGGSGFHGERFHVMRRVGKKAAGRLLDGVIHDGFPETNR